MNVVFRTVLTAGLLAAPMASAATPVDKFHVTPEEHAACDADAVRLCSDTHPDQDKLLSCMRANRAALSITCRPVFDAGLHRRHLRM